MVLGKVPVPGRRGNFDWGSALVVDVGLIDWTFFFLVLFSSSLGDGPIQTEILSQGVVKPKQPAKHRGDDISTPLVCKRRANKTRHFI